MKSVLIEVCEAFRLAEIREVLRSLCALQFLPNQNDR